jgi:AraC-like DNA-binding protein
MSYRLHPSSCAVVDLAERPDEPDGNVDANYLLGLLTQAQQALKCNSPRAHHYLEHVCRLLRQAIHIPGRPLGSASSNVDAHLPSKAGGLASWQVRKVTAYIESRLNHNMVTEDLALVVSLSPGHFCRAFKVSMGETPHAYVTRQRICLAQRLMLETRHSLSDIACACGLSDQAHLTRLFKRLVGTTPMMWRRTWQGSKAGMGRDAGLAA